MTKRTKEHQQYSTGFRRPFVLPISRFKIRLTLLLLCFNNCPSVGAIGEYMYI